ncbi:hypothetical protein MMC16_003599 [Acarospora aff. strigata]|nr:hypothetical protein [Acarospora aff. strigata]
MAVYNVWFWWTGLQIMRETPCGTFVFFFAKVNLYGWYRKANLVLAILAICSNVLIECGSFLRLVRHFLARKIRSTEYQERLMGKLQEGIDDERPCLRINGMNQDFPLLDDHNPSVTMPKNKTNKRTCKGSQSHKQDDTLLLTRTATMPSLPSWTVRSPLRTTSFHSDLTNSESPPTANTAPQSDNKNSQLPNFQQLYIADKYVAEVFAAHSFAITQRKHFKIVLLPGHLDVYIPYFRPSFNHDAVSLHTCIITAVTAVRRRRLNPLALIVLFLYIYETRTQPFYRYPWLLHCALTQPSHAEQDWRTLTTVTDILVSREPDEVRKWYWIPSAVQSGLVSVGLVLSIELTISWNRITNVNNIRTVGQLIPFILGCGGLIKVLWAKLRMSWHSTGQEAGENDLGPAEVGLADVYDKRKERYERSLGIRLHREPGSEEIV